MSTLNPSTTFISLTVFVQPHLLSFAHMSKTAMGVVWLAGPLAGVLQPVIGFWSDTCRVSWGRRLPFMLIGGLGATLSLLSLAYADDLARSVNLAEALPASWREPLPRIIAAVSVYALNVAIQFYQVASRALILDICPVEQQATANAWASTTLGVFNVLTFLLGSFDLPRLFPILGETRIKCLSIMAMLVNVVVLTISAAVNREQQHQKSMCKTDAGIFRQMRNISITLPPQVQGVLKVQFFAWLGWSPFLYYVSR